MFTHVFFPRSIWPQADLCTAIDTVGSWIWLLGLFFSDLPEKEYRICLVCSNQNSRVSSGDLDAIQKIRARARFMLSNGLVGLLIILLTDFYLQIYYNGTYRVSWMSGIYWFGLFPQYLNYFLHFLYTTPFYLGLASAYLRIQLSSLHQEFVALNRKLVRPGRIMRDYHGFYRKFLGLNRRLLSLCRGQNVYGRFWSHYLTNLLISFSMLQCYCVYIFGFTNRANHLAIRLLFLMVGVELSVLQFIIIDQCARVVKWNGRILRQNARFHYGFQRRTRGRLPRFLLKLEILQNCRLLSGYGFRVFGEYRITSRTFHLMFTYISAFLLHLIKSQYYHQD